VLFALRVLFRGKSLASLSEENDAGRWRRGSLCIWNVRMNRVEPTVAVMKSAKSNRFRTFKFKNTARSELSGAYRMRSGDYCEVIHRPKFQIPADASVFTLGSCFAREVEAALLDRRFRLLGMSVDIPEELLALPQYRLANSSMLRAKAGLFNAVQISLYARMCSRVRAPFHRA
jgi:hypothetical protein